MGLSMLHVVGEDNVMIETDYPHSDTTWPYSLKLAHERLNAAKLSPEVQYKILRGNAERLYQFEAAEPPQVVRP
jgi:predicted TIM-barrel fold metal-dependent hydrolase